MKEIITKLTLTDCITLLAIACGFVGLFITEHFNRRKVRLANRVSLLFRLKEHINGGNFNAEDIAKIHEGLWWWQKRRFDHMCAVWWSNKRGSDEWRKSHQAVIAYVESIFGK